MSRNQVGRCYATYSAYSRRVTLRFWAVRENRRASEMFKNTFQSGFLSILYSIGSKPLQIWDKKVTIDLCLCWDIGGENFMITGCTIYSPACVCSLLSGSQWTHQENNRQWHSVASTGDYGDKCQVKGPPVPERVSVECSNCYVFPLLIPPIQHNLHHMSCWSQEDPGHQTSLPRHDHQEPEEILHLWSSGTHPRVFYHPVIDLLP